MSIERKIVITADSGQAESAVEQMAERTKSSFTKVAESIEDVSKKIKESNDDISKQFEELDQTTSEIFSDLVKESEKYSDSSKERATYLDNEIKKLERINKEEDIRARILAKSRYDKKAESSVSDEERKKARERYEQELRENNVRSQMANAQTRALRDKKQEYIRSQEEEDPDRTTVSAGHSGGDSHGGNGSRGGGNGSRGGGEHGFLGGLKHKAQHLGHGVAHGVGSALGFGALFSVGGFVHKVMHEGEERAKAEARAKAMGINVPGIEGLKTADAIAYSKQVALASGTGNIARIAKEQSIIERGTGMELGSLTQYQTPIAWMEKEKGKNVADVSVEMLSIMKKSGLYNIDKSDFTLTHELLERNNQLIGLESQKAEQISTKTASQLQAAFGLVGGSFSDQRQVATIGSISKGITDPGNDFKNAFIMRSIKKQDPNASLLDVMMAKEQGVFKEGQFASIMKDISETFQGDQRVFSISKMFGLNLQQSKKLAESYEQDPTRFDKIGSTEEIEKTITKDTIAGRGGITEMEKITARFDDKLSEWGDVVIHKIEDMIGAFEKGGIGGLASKMTEDLIGGIGKAFEAGGKLFKEALLSSGDVITEMLDEKLGTSLAPEKPLSSGEKVSELNNKAVELLMSEKADNLNEYQLENLERIKKRILTTPTRTNKDTPESIVERIEEQHPDIFQKHRGPQEGMQLARGEAAKDIISSGKISKLDFSRATEEEEKTVKETKKAIVLESANDLNFIKALREYEETGKSSNSHLNSLVYILERMAKATESRKENYATQSAN